MVMVSGKRITVLVHICLVRMLVPTASVQFNVVPRGILREVPPVDQIPANQVVQYVVSQSASHAGYTSTLRRLNQQGGVASRCEALYARRCGAHVLTCEHTHCRVRSVTFKLLAHHTKTQSMVDARL